MVAERMSDDPYNEISMHPCASRLSVQHAGTTFRVTASPATHPNLNASTLLESNVTLFKSDIAMEWARAALLCGISLDDDCHFGHFDNKVPVQRRF